MDGAGDVGSAISVTSTSHLVVDFLRNKPRNWPCVEAMTPRGTAEFYQGENAALTIEGADRVLTEAGRQFFEESRHLID
jgi:hypothetical protein